MTSINGYRQPHQPAVPAPSAAPMPSSAGVSPAHLQKTSRHITVGIWVCAVITMTASVVNGTSVFISLTHGALPVFVGFLTALAVDAALVVVLTGDSKMQDLEIPSSWGRAMRWLLLLMSLGLNCGASLLDQNWFLAALHSLPPVLLCGLSEYGQEVGNKFARAVRLQGEWETAQKRTAAEQSEAARTAEQTRRDGLQKAEDERRKAEAYASARPAELEAEQRKRDAEQRDRDRQAAELEQIRHRRITLTGYLFLARRLQAAALAAKHAGIATQRPYSTTPRNGAPGGRTSPAPAPHQVPAPGAAPASAPGLHQDPAPGAPGAAPGAHQPRPPAPGRATAAGGNGQVRADIAWFADLAEPWLDANPGAGRIRLRQELVRLVREAGATAGAHLVQVPGEDPGARITDDVGKKVLKEIKRRQEQREIAHLESLLAE